MAHPFVHGTAATDAKLRVPVSCYHPVGSQPVTVRTECSRRDYLKCLCCTRNHILTMTQSHLKALLCHRAGARSIPTRLRCLFSLPSSTTPSSSPAAGSRAQPHVKTETKRVCIGSKWPYRGEQGHFAHPDIACPNVHIALRRPVPNR